MGQIGPTSHITFLRSSQMSSNDEVHRVFNEQERAAIDEFKPLYMEATSPAGRLALAKAEIFPALFNYWKTLGRIYNDEETDLKSKVC